MGLDQYAFINPREEKRTNDEGKEYTVKIAEQDFLKIACIYYLY